MDYPLIGNYKELFVNDIPLIDVRAPVEFQQGAFPLASNLPLMNDQERHNVGIRYKEQGQEKAIELGHELVSNEIKQQRVNNWRQFAEQNPQGALYCFRGGLRSKISQQWIYEHSSILYPRVEGGYKAMRQFLLQELETSAEYFTPLVLGGRTGTGKTLLLNQLQNRIDLEGIFVHRGSAFGRYAQPQPSQIDVENRLAISLLKYRHLNIQKIIFEDEAANIGSRRIPDSLFNLLKTASLVLLETEFEERVDNIFNEYINESLADYCSEYGTEQGFDTWSSRLLESLDRIQRRLGGERYRHALAVMQHALEHHHTQPELHKAWIAFILHDYYDPMYDYQLSNKSERIIFSGTAGEILEFLTANHNII